MEEGNYRKLGKMGDGSALEMLAQQGKWEECLEMAAN